MNESQAPSTHQTTTRHTVQLTPEQYTKLCDELNPARIGEDGKGYRHVEAWDVKASLTRVFGFGMWSTEVLSEERVCDYQKTDANGRPGNWVISYRVRMRLTCYDPYGQPLGPFEDGTIETGNMGKREEAEELAYKSALSGALKRCATGLGNQFGLSLYAKPKPGRGPVLSVISGTLNPPDTDTEAEQAAA